MANGISRRLLYFYSYMYSYMVIAYCATVLRTRALGLQSKMSCACLDLLVGRLLSEGIGV